MTHPGHNITHCVHGTIVSQCRCAIKDKPSVVVECPRNCDARRVHLAGSDEVLWRVENQLYAMRNDGWDLRPFVDLANALRETRELTVWAVRNDVEVLGVPPECHVFVHGKFVANTDGTQMDILRALRQENLKDVNAEHTDAYRNAETPNDADAKVAALPKNYW